MADSWHTETILTGAAWATPLPEERPLVGRRVVETGRVRIRLSNSTEDAVMRGTLRSERVEMERVPMHREVAVAPAAREEDGAFLVVPVVVVLVTERRLVLKEEPRIRRVSTSSTSDQTVPLRCQTATVERVPARLGADPEHNGRHDGAGDPT